MGRKKRAVKPLETIWEVSDELWAKIEPILLEDAPPPPPAKGGRKRTDWRAAFNGVIFRMRSGCQWNRLPERFGDDSSVHRWFQRWNKNGVMEKIWAVLVEDCGELGGVLWEWQSADGAMGKARFGGDEVGPNPTDRGKNGVKRSVIVDQDGGPLGAVIAGANVHDAKLLAATIEAIVVDRPEPTPEAPQHLCLDKGYDNPTGREAASAKGHTPHIRRIGEEKGGKAREKKHRPRRWVVERTHSWLSKCRAILVRYDRNSFNYLGLIQLACGLLWYRRLHRLQAET
ncbi:IS5 family transposase (plasmid) [Tundrisphaera lichenicola]|uniref:IS5 family transposase n=1 Tax=Tundrisphaera lichenicola TaxID=2029860 RepID=UPI003EBE4DED